MAHPFDQQAVDFLKNYFIKETVGTIGSEILRTSKDALCNVCAYGPQKAPDSLQVEASLSKGEISVSVDEDTIADGVETVWRTAVSGTDEVYDDIVGAIQALWGELNEPILVNSNITLLHVIVLTGSIAALIKVIAKSIADYRHRRN